MFIFKFLILAGLIRLLPQTSPLTVASIYTVLVFILSLILGTAFVNALIIAAVSFALAFLYFWLLEKTQGSALFWVVLLGGVFIGII